MRLKPRTPGLRVKHLTTEPRGTLPVSTGLLYHLTHNQTTNFRLFQTDHNFKFDENGRKLSKQAENTVGKGEIACYNAISSFLTVFSKGLFPRGIKRCHCVGMG